MSRSATPRFSQTAAFFSGFRSGETLGVRSAPAQESSGRLGRRRRVRAVIRKLTTETAPRLGFAQCSSAFRVWRTSRTSRISHNPHNRVRMWKGFRHVTGNRVNRLKRLQRLSIIEREASADRVWHFSTQRLARPTTRRPVVPPRVPVALSRMPARWERQIDQTLPAC